MTQGQGNNNLVSPVSVSHFAEKKDLSPSEDWGVDQQLISRLTEQYRKERQKGKKAIQQSRV